MELLSIIVPVYNAGQYLENCINSILNQSYSNIELILIDDGSVDQSAAICKKFCEKDKRVKYWYKENEGACLARRDGLFLASANYVTFVDSDDWITKNIYQDVFTQMIVNQADVATFAYQMSDSQVIYYDLPKPGLYTDTDKDKICETMIYDEKAYRCGIACSLWTKIYRRDLLIEAMKNLNSGLTLWEDLTYLYLPFVWAKRVLITDVLGYNYRQNSTSVTHMDDEEEVTKTVFAFETAKKNYAFCSEKLQNTLVFMYARALRDIMWRSCINHKEKIVEMANNPLACKAVEEALQKQSYIPHKDKKMLGFLIHGQVNQLCQYYRVITMPKKMKKSVGRNIRKVLGWK